MYLNYYGLSAKPFRLSPDPHFFFTSSTHKSAFAYLRYGLHQGEGFIVVTGAAGAGKTTLILSLLSKLSPRQMVIGELVTTQLQADDLLRAIAAAFHLDTCGAKAELIVRLQEFFLARARVKQRVLLVVDEAHNLPQISFEELRMLSNFQQGPTALLQCILLGQPPLWDMLTRLNMEHLQQRVIAAHQLHPLSAEETRGYILHRLRQAGWHGDPGFSAGAVKLIHRYCHGIPRRINSLCDRALLFGALEEKHHIDADVITEVYSEWASETGQAAPPESLLQTKMDELNLAGLGNEHGIAAQAVGADTVPLPLKPGVAQRNAAALPPSAVMTGWHHDLAPSSPETVDPAATEPPSPMALLRPILRPMAGVAAALIMIILAAVFWSGRNHQEMLTDDIASSPSPQAQQAETAMVVVPPPLPTPALNAERQDVTPSTATATRKVVEKPPAAQAPVPDAVEPAHVAAIISKPATAPSRIQTLENGDNANEKIVMTRPRADPKASTAVTAPAPQVSAPIKEPEQNVTAMRDGETTASRSGDSIPPVSQMPEGQHLDGAVELGGPTSETTPSTPATLARIDPSTAKTPTAAAPGEMAVTPAPAHAAPISAEELVALLARFKGAYDAGDMTTLTQMFSVDAHSDEANDREAIARTYRKLFNVTDERQLALEDIRWQEAGKAMQGEGRFGVTVREIGRGLESTYNGHISLRIEKRDGRPVITQLEHSYTP